MAGVDFSLNVLDTQSGLKVEWSDLQDKLASLNKSINDVKRLIVVVSDTLTDSTDDSTKIKTYYPVPSEYYTVIPNADLVYSRTYVVGVKVRMANDSYLFGENVSILFSAPPSQPSAFLLPQNKSLRVKMNNMSLDYWGTSSLENIYIDVFTHVENVTQLFRHDIIPVNSNKLTKVGDEWTYTIENLQNKTKYEVQIRYENETKESQDLDLIGTPSRVSEAPRNLTVDPVFSGVLYLNWSKPADAVADGYNINEYWIYRSTTNVASSFVKVDTVVGSQLSYFDNNSGDFLTNGVRYYYKVAAALEVDPSLGEEDVIEPTTDGFNVSEYSNTASSLVFNVSVADPVVVFPPTIVLPPPQDAPVALPSFTVTGGDGKLVFSLVEPIVNTGKPYTSADYFEINYSDGNNEFTTDPIYRTSSPISYEIPDLTNGVTYTVKVRYTQNYEGSNFVGPYTATQTRTPYSNVPAVQNLVSTPVDSDANKSPLSIGDNGVLRLSWDKVNYDNLGVFNDDIRYEVSKVVNSSPLTIYDNGFQSRNINATGTEFATMYFTADNNYKVVTILSNFASVSMVQSTQDITATIKTLEGLNVGSVTSSVVLNPNMATGVFSFGATATLESGKVYRVVYTSPVQLYEMIGQQGGYTTLINGYSFANETIVSNIQGGQDDSVVQDISGLSLDVPYELNVKAYYLNPEEDQQKNSLLETVGPSLTTKPFNYPTNGSNLELTGGDGVITANWTNDANTNGGDYIRYQIVVKQNGDEVQTIDDLALADTYQITGLNNGYTYTVELSAYTVYDNERYYSTEGGYADLVESVTTFGPLDTPQNFSSTPIDDDNSPLSVGDNGKLKLSWSRMELPGVWANALRYRVEIGDQAIENIPNGSDPSTVELLVSGLTLGQSYFPKVYAYFVNQETGQSYYSGARGILPDESTRPFNYPTNASNLSLVASDGSIDASWDNSANAKGGYNLKYELVVKEDSNIVQTIDEISELSHVISQLTNGVTHTVVLSSYTTYLGVRYYSNEGGYVDQSATRTPYSVPNAPSDFISTPVDENNEPLSTKVNGKLKLSWSDLSYDLVNGSASKWSNNIKYQVLDENNDLLDNYDNLTSSNVLVQNLTLGESRGLKVQAYFYNSEDDEYVYGNISSALNEHNSPFAIPDDVESPMSSDPADQAVEFSWVAGNGRGLTPQFETQLDSNASELNQSSPKNYSNLVNGTLYTLNVKTYTEYTPRGEVSPIKYYASEEGVSKQEIPRRPASIVRNLQAYPQADKFAATFDVPADLGGAEFDKHDSFNLSGYRYTIKNLETQQDVVTADEVSVKSELIVREPLTSGQRYELKVWAVTEVNGPSGVTTGAINGVVSILEFSYFVSGSTVAPDVHDLIITPGDSQLEVTFGFENSSDPNTQYEIILYEVDPSGNLTDLNRILGPNSESAPVDGVVSETLTDLTNFTDDRKYKVVVLVSSLDNSGNRVYDSESKFGTPTADVPSGVQELVATNGDDGETTLTWSAPSVGAPDNKTLYYQVVNKDEWNLLDSGIVNDDKVNLTGEVISAVNDVVYTAMVRPYYIDDDGNRVYGPFKTVQALPLPEPEKVTLKTAVPGDEEVVLSWNNVSASDNIIYPKTELEILVRDVWPVAGDFAHLKTIYAVNGEIPVSTYTHNEIDDSDIENGKIYEYKLILKNNKSVVANDSYAENVDDELVPSSYNSSEDLCNDSGVAESTRPYDKPIVTVLPLDYNGNTTTFTMNISHNGRYVREILVVGVPTNDSLARDQDIMVVQKHFNFNSATNVLASASTALVENVSFPYTVKSVLYIVENYDGNTVGTYPTLGL